MKYIRTEDGEVRTTIHLYKNEDGSYSNANREIFGLPRIIVVKESDNLEELCDYVWYKEKHHEPKLERICFNVAKAMKQPRTDGAFEYVRFMILVGKDLKTVAEMNDKGELELL